MPLAPIAVVAYPAFAPEDLQWIESLRWKHDPKGHGQIAAHLTLVFPCRLSELDGLTRHIDAVAHETPALPFTLSGAAVVPELPGAGFVTQLTARDGAEALTALHDRLYEALPSLPRPGDPPYAPHITVGRSRWVKDAIRLSARLNIDARVISGEIARLSLIRVFRRKVTLLEERALAG